MPIINFTNPITILIGVILFLLVLYLAKETKKSWIVGILLFVYIGILVGHSVEFTIMSSQSEQIYKAITTSSVFDFIFILLTFLSYLWVDELEVKEGKKNSIDDSLEWFWSKV